MAAPPKSSYMFCYGDFATKLVLAAVFVKDNGLHQCSQVSLHLKGRPGRSWAAKMKKIEGVFYITDGQWSQFVKDNNILQMNLLIFDLVTPTALHVSIFSHHSCSNQSFFTYCLGDFATKLAIPAMFVDVHGLHHSRQLSLHLKTQPSGRSWAVKIEKIDGVFYLADGWSEFVEGSDIVKMKLVAFDIVGASTLQVSIFGHHCCLEPPYSSSPTTWRFVRKLKEFNFIQQRLEIPKKFAVAMQAENKEVIDVEDSEGRKWPIAITDKNIGSYGFSSGFKKFLIANKLQPGTILLFEFTSDSDGVVKVVVMEDEAGEKLLSRAKYGGLLPTI